MYCAYNDVRKTPIVNNTGAKNDIVGNDVVLVSMSSFNRLQTLIHIEY
jgi:hypothetical protein